ncbi:MAG TPA: HIT family protein [Alphaproteobacteria bacterium]|nr:HIT family protein [Alphaproteobacteria bacterium]
MNETMQTFGYSDNLIYEYNNWVVLLRPAQVTLGSLVLIEKSETTNFANISQESFSELKEVITDIENNLKTHFNAEKFNYLMLMMVDPNVHYHVIPRYSENKTFNNETFKDTGWPKLPEMPFANEILDDSFIKLKELLKNNWK